MIHFLTVAYSLLLTSTTIALAQTTAIAQPQPFAREFSEVTRLAGKPGVPGRRVGGGSRLY